MANSFEKLSCTIFEFALQGYNAAIIAYGQTGTGKTFTMEGDRTGPGRGIIPRAIEDVFAAIEHDAAPHSKFLVRATYLQIYNEVRVFGGFLEGIVQKASHHLVLHTGCGCSMSCGECASWLGTCLLTFVWGEQSPELRLRGTCWAPICRRSYRLRHG